MAELEGVDMATFLEGKDERPLEELAESGVGMVWEGKLRLG